MFKKKITIITTVLSIVLTMTSCGNTTDTEELANTTTSSYSESSIAEEIDTSSDVSSIEEIDSTEDSSEDESSEIDSSEVDSSEAEKVTTTIDDSSKVEKKTTTTTKKTTSQPARTTTTKTTIEYVETTTQPVVTQAPVTQEPVTTTTVKQTAKPVTTTTAKQTAKPATTTTKKTETPKKDKYQLAFEKVGGYNNHVGESGYGYTEADLKTIREYYINYAVSKFGSRVRNCNKEFIPFYDANGKLTHVFTNNYVPATWQYYYGAEEIDRVTYLIDGYLTEFLKNDSSDLTHTDYYWDVFWMIDSDNKTVYFSVAIF